MKLSIITINYNNFDGLQKTMQSVFSQSFKDFEYIVIDGGSDDGSKELIEQNSSKITYWVSESDNGIYHAMNKGIKKAKGDYVFFLNSGDTFYNDAVLQQIVNSFTSKKDIYYGNVMINEDESYVKTFPKELSFRFFFQQTITHQAVFVKRELFDTVFYFNESLKFVSDWEYLINAICKYNANYEYVDVIVSNYDLLGVSSLNSSKKKIEEERLSSLKKHFPLFIKDYEELERKRKRLKSDNFKMFLELEKHKFSRKLNTRFFKLVLGLLKFKLK